MIVKGTTDKKITWKGTDGGVTYNTWVSSENFDLASGKILTLNGVNIADPTAQTIGPVNGTGTDDVNLGGGGTAYTLGSAVLNSSLTSVGTLTSLSVAGNVSSGTPSEDGTTAGSRLGSNGKIVAARSGSGNQIFEGFLIGNSSPTVVITNDGSATFAGNITPSSDATVDLGSSSLRWANIYSADLQLSNEGAANEVDGTWGQYTIQEGEDDLFLINRRSGKKYKFMLQEVQ